VHIPRNNVKEKLARDEVVASMTVRLVRDAEIARMAQAAGFDTLYVDLEHGSLSFDDSAPICRMAREIGIAPFMRVPMRDQVARALQCGALGVIVPHIESAEQARAVVAAAGAARGDGVMIVVQIESAEALDAIDDIAAVDGVDLALIGVNDFLSDRGIPGQYDHALVRDIYARAIAAFRPRGKHVGVGGLSTRPDLIAQFVRIGARYVSTGTDHAFLLAACTEHARQVRSITYPSPERGGSDHEVVRGGVNDR
jgi:4-hydroxy-2-oxoheptanedioate aldolase